MGVGQKTSARNAGGTFGADVPGTFADQLKLSVPRYNGFKARRGFFGEEINEKIRSLGGVLAPFSARGNLDTLGRAGSQDVTTIRKLPCFNAFLAI